jgi:hypothetical protein
MTDPVITGSAHPLTRRIFELDRARRADCQRWRPTAGQLLADHLNHGVSDQTVYRIDAADPPAWTRLGSYENERHLLGHGPDYFAVCGRDPIDLVVRRLVDHRHTTLVELRRLRADAELIAPMVGVLLVMLVTAGMLRWDTDETVMQAGLRHAQDTAWHRHVNPPIGVPLTRPAALYAETATDIGLTDAYRDATVAAQWWLAHRHQVTDEHDEFTFVVGAELLDAAAAADRAGVLRSTWTSYASRHEAPSPDRDHPSRWYLPTVLSWRLTRPQTPWPDW